MDNIQIFNNPQFGDIRVAGTSEYPLFCLADICKAVDLSNPSSVKLRLDIEDLQLVDLHALNSKVEIIGNSNATFINETAFYDVLLFSSSSKVKPYRRWITHEVLPSIRKHGAYMTQDVLNKALTSPDFLIQLATELKMEQQKRIEAEETTKLQSEQLKLQAPKIQYVDEVLQSVNTYNANLIAKEMGMSAETMNHKLCEMGILYKQSGVWVLTCKYQNKGFTKTRTHSFTRSDGSQGTSMLTVWTERGREFIHKLFTSKIVK